MDLKIDQVDDGQSTVTEGGDEEVYEEFWRTQADEFGLNIDPDREGADD